MKGQLAESKESIISPPMSPVQYTAMFNEFSPKRVVRSNLSSKAKIEQLQ